MPGPGHALDRFEDPDIGRRAGIAVVAGLMLGVLVQTLAVALGLAAVFAASATAFTLLKFAGAAYLVYLAWGAWRAPVAALGAAGSAAPAQPWPRLLLRGVLMNLSNPKVVLFFLALLPQFVQPGRGPVALQLLWFGALFIVAGSLVFGAVVLVAGALRARLAGSARVQRGLNRAAALVFVALAARLATAQR